jgi:hypothetical protein
LVSQPLAHDCGQEIADDLVASVPGSCDGQVSLDVPARAFGEAVADRVDVSGDERALT